MSRKHPSHEAADERPETEVQSFEQTEAEEEEKSRLRLAREAKIGLAVIGVLLVVLGAVIYNRISSAGEKKGTSAEAPSPKTDSGQSTPSSQPEAAGRTPGASFPSILPAQAGAVGDAAPGLAPSLGSWGSKSESRQAGAGHANTTLPAAPPSFPPNMVSVAPADRYAENRSTESATSPRRLWPSSSGYTDERADEMRQSGRLDASTAQAESEDDRLGASPQDNLDAAPALISNATLMPAPETSQVKEADLSGTPQENPLRVHTMAPGAGDITDSSRSSTGLALTVPSPTVASPAPAATFSGAGASPELPGLAPSVAYRTGQPSQAKLAESPLPSPVADSQSAYRTASQFPNRTVQTDAPAASGPGDASQRYTSAGASGLSGGGGAQQWASGASLGQSDRTTPASASGSSSSMPGPTSPVSTATFPMPATASSGPRATPELPASGTYLVQPNDNYWNISQKLYGTGAYFRALAAYNRAKVPEPDRLQVGDAIQAPTVAQLQAAHPDLCPKPAHQEAAQRRALARGSQTPLGRGRVYVVQEGDNLFNIARYELGKAARWTEIVDLNKDLLGPDLHDLNYLTPGMKLVLPEERSESDISQRPGSLYPR